MPYAVGTDTDRLTYLTAPLSPLTSTPAENFPKFIGVPKLALIYGQERTDHPLFYLLYYLGVKHLIYHLRFSIIYDIIIVRKGKKPSKMKKGKG